MTDEATDKSTRPEQWMRQIWLFLLRIAIIAGATYVIWRVRGIVSDVLVSAIVAFALVGPVDRLCQRRPTFLAPRAMRLIVTLVVFLVVATLIGVGVSVMVSPFQQEVHSLKMSRASMVAAAESAKTWYHSLPPALRDYAEKQLHSSSMPSPGDWIANALQGTFAGISKIVDIILIPVLAFYFVLDGRELRNEFLAVLPRARRKEAITLLRESSSIMRTFIVAQIWLCVIAGVVVFSFLYAFGMPSPLILALLAGVTRAIPIVGPIISGIPIVLLALLQPHGFVLALKVLTFFSIMHLIESKLIMPKFIGHRIHLHAALVIISLLIGYEFFGLIGMFMAAPVAAFARVLVNYYVIRPRRLSAQANAVVERSRPSLIMKSQ